jgi:alpha-L-rhamnosidase
MIGSTSTLHSATTRFPLLRGCVISIATFTAYCGWAAAPASAAMTIGELRCEYTANPLGIDTLKPRLSWTLLDSERGQRQTAYQLQVAETPEGLQQGNGLLWDSNKVASDQNVNVVYAGPSLRSGMRCYWRVRAWDKQDQPSVWSSPALWQVALLDAHDWKAQWIGLDDKWTPDWRDVAVTVDCTLQKGAVGIVFRAQDENNFYLWQINNTIGNDLLLRPHVLKNGQWTILPAVSLRQTCPSFDDGKKHRIEIKVEGDQIRTSIDGKQVDERRDATFAAGAVGFRADREEQFTVSNIVVVDAQGKLLLRENFQGSRLAFPEAKENNGQLFMSGQTLLHRPLPKDCPRLRKTFNLAAKPIRRASASVCGLGFYELYVNGAKAGDRVLAPANTPYSQRILFDTLDVTDQVKQGANAMGLWLAPGYSDDYSRYGWKWEQPKRAIVQLDVVYEDGTTESVGTDGSWLSGPSPIENASLYNGETYDAGLETPGWATAGFTGDGWRPVRVLSPTGAALKPNTMPPIRVTQTIRPVSVAEPKPGVFVFDMGQGFAGWTRVRATGPRGTRIVIRHSELIDKEGNIDPWTSRDAKATDTFVLAGQGSETYEPRFTYHGIRYVEVSGYPGRPTLDDVTGCVVHADVKPIGNFVSSNELINRIQQNCTWSMRSNFMSIPTDCCMRDERTPCQMDSQAYEDASICNFWMDRFYAKWLDDISGGQGNPDWNGDAVTLPWRLYQQYGDLRILETQYSNMRAYVEFIDAKVPNHLWEGGFGDWLAPNKGTWADYFKDVTDVNTCIYAETARIVSETAALLGKPDDAAKFGKLFDEIKQAYNEKRYNAAQAAYGEGSQTTAILPLVWNLVPPDRRAAVFAHLITRIHEHDKDHIGTGIFGTRYLVDVLSDFGKSDLAVRMLTQPDYPGFGDQIAQGATTLWEQWTFKGSMNSHNHVCFAGVSSSFFTRLAGITSLQPGYAEIGIRPAMPDNLTFVEASEDTVKGRIAVRWQRDREKIEMRVSIPVNTIAKITWPGDNSQAVLESGKPADQAEGVTHIANESGHIVLTVGSGDYCFTNAVATKQP